MVLEEHRRDGVESEPVETESIDAEVKVGSKGGKIESATCYPPQRKLQNSQEEAKDFGLPVVEDAAGRKGKREATRQLIDSTRHEKADEDSRSPYRMPPFLSFSEVHSISSVEPVEGKAASASASVRKRREERSSSLVQRLLEIRTGVTVDDVEDHSDPKLMSFLDERYERLDRSCKRGRKSVRAKRKSGWRRRTNRIETKRRSRMRPDIRRTRSKDAP